VVGGLIFSQMLTLYTTPVVYLYMDRFGRWFRRLWNRLTGMPVTVPVTAGASQATLQE
jgi:multidrug efflux pump